MYKDYYDVRLVFAPPSSVGKFGGDTDNWVWPRHTGDFSVFRIYADQNNQPAAYSPENVPYHPDYLLLFLWAGMNKVHLHDYGISRFYQQVFVFIWDRRKD